MKGETERERLLLAYQVNDEVQQGHFPVNKELALEVAALLAQVKCWLSSQFRLHSTICHVNVSGEPDLCVSISPVRSNPGGDGPNERYLLLLQVEHGDLEKPAAFAAAAASPQAKSQLLLLQVLDRFYPKRYRQDSTPEQLR